MNENNEQIVKQKSNKGVIIILIILLISALSYIAYDKFITKDIETIQNENKNFVSEKEKNLIEAYLTTNSDANAFLQIIFPSIADIDMEYVLGQKYLYGQSIVEDCGTNEADCTKPTFRKVEINSLFKTYTGQDISILKNKIPSYDDYRYNTTKFDGGYINFYADTNPIKIKSIKINENNEYVIRYDGVAYGYDFSNPFEKELTLKIENNKLLFVSNIKVNN